MTKYTKAALFLVLTTVGATTQTYAESAPRQIDVKSTMIQRCASEAVTAKITDQSTANKLCTCTINVQANNLKLGEFWSIQSATMSGQDPRSIAAFKRIQPMLDKCRAGIKLNLPGASDQPAK